MDDPGGSADAGLAGQAREIRDAIRRHIITGGKLPLPEPIAYEYFKMRWCREWGWTPQQFDAMPADTMQLWQEMLAGESEAEERRGRLQQAKANRSA